MIFSFIERYSGLDGGKKALGGVRGGEVISGVNRQGWGVQRAKGTNALVAWLDGEKG